MFITTEKKDKVWAKAIIDPNNDPGNFRKDHYGNWIQYSQYGNRDSDYGWEIDHHMPESMGGPDYISNLYPVQWRANLAKSDNLSFSQALALLKQKSLF